jgi:hypothetical protein
MNDEQDETRLISPPPAPNDETMLTPPVSSSRAALPDAATVAIPSSHGGASGLSRPLSASAAARSAAAPAIGVSTLGENHI